MEMPVQQRRYSIAEYMELELAATERHEYQEGEILAMSGGSLNHSLIITNIVGETRSALKGKSCRVADSNLRVRISRKGRYVYPDGLIFCGDPQFDPQDPNKHTLLNPRVIVEVLSPSTEAYDRGDKFAQYRQIESFEEYILISQDRPSVETILRQSDGAWSFSNYTGLEAMAKIRSLGIDIPLTEIYAGISLPLSATEEDAQGEG